MVERRKSYQTGKVKGQKRRPGEDLRKFAVKKGVYYHWVPIKHFKSKKRAKAWIEEEKRKRPSIRYRIIKNSPTTYKKIHRKYTVYQTIYP